MGRNLKLTRKDEPSARGFAKIAGRETVRVPVNSATAVPVTAEGALKLKTPVEPVCKHTTTWRADCY